MKLIPKQNHGKWGLPKSPQGPCAGRSCCGGVRVDTTQRGTLKIRVTKLWPRAEKGTHPGVWRLWAFFRSKFWSFSIDVSCVRSISSVDRWFCPPSLDYGGREAPAFGCGKESFQPLKQLLNKESMNPATRQCKDR